MTKAIARLKYAIKWRKDFKVNEMIKSAHNPTSEEEIMIRSMLINESSSGKIYVRGYDKEGRAILYMRQQRENTKHEENNIKVNLMSTNSFLESTGITMKSIMSRY